MTYNLLKKYENFHLAQGTFYGGKVETSKLVDNGNPGMGTYDPLDQFKPPSYLIKKKKTIAELMPRKILQALVNMTRSGAMKLSQEAFKQESVLEMQFAERKLARIS